MFDVVSGPIVVPTAQDERVHGWYTDRDALAFPATENAQHFGLTLAVYTAVQASVTATLEVDVNVSGRVVDTGTATLDAGVDISGVPRFIDIGAITLVADVGVEASSPTWPVYTPPAYPLFVPAQLNTRRVIVQEILTGRFLEWDLPLGQVEYTKTLCGPDIITGTLTPEMPDLLSVGLEAGAVWLHVEEDGRIQASGILQPQSIDPAMGAITVEAEGFTGYAATVPYRDVWALRGKETGLVGVELDPLDIVREGWRHMQSYPDGNLGVTVDATETPVRLGEEERDVEFTTGEGEEVAFVAGPFKWNWWENTLIGSEIDKLAVETPFEYVERSGWNTAKTTVLHHLELAYPRRGRARDDLSFEQGRNIISMLPFAEDEEYASEVIVTGKGEGSASVWGNAVTRRGRRIRKVQLVEDKEVASRRQADAIAADALGKAAPVAEIKEITIVLDHEDAPAGSFTVGDDILVRGVVPYVGDVSLWHRVISLKPSWDSGTAVVGLIRTERFVYGPMGQAALAEQGAGGVWFSPNTHQHPTSPYGGPSYRNAEGEWVPIGGAR